MIIACDICQGQLEPIVNDMHSPSKDRRSARRRLIKGSFAAPAALTLASGSAFARTSSRCVANDANAGVKPVFDTDNATWLRLQAYDYKPNGTNKVTSYWIKGSDVVALANAAGVSVSGPWISVNQYLCVQGGTAPTGNLPYVTGNIYSSGTSPTAPESFNSTAPLRYYAVLFDANGNITGISFSESGLGGAVHKSCWTSFRVA